MNQTSRFAAKPQRDFAGRYFTNNSGAAAVEFAVVFPLFLLITIAVLAYGIYYGAAHSVQQLAADAARSSVPGLSTVERATLAQSYVSANAASYPLLHANKVTVATSPGPASDDDMVVTVTYDSRALPIWGFSTLLPLPSPTIQRIAVIRRGGPQ